MAGYPPPPPGYPVVAGGAGAGPSSGFAVGGPAVDARAAPDAGADKPAAGGVAASVPYQQQQQQQQYPPQQQGYPGQQQQGYPGQQQQQQPQAFVDPNTGQTVYYAPNGQPYYANNQVYPPPPANPYMAAYPQQQGQQPQYAGGGGAGAGAGGAGAGMGCLAGLVGALGACLCLDMIF